MVEIPVRRKSPGIHCCAQKGMSQFYFPFGSGRFLMCSRRISLLVVRSCSAIASSFSFSSSVTRIWMVSFLAIGRCRRCYIVVLCHHKLNLCLPPCRRSHLRQGLFPNLQEDILMISLKAPECDIFDAPSPSPTQWKRLVIQDEALILTPQEFRQRWNISNKQMARMCFCSPATVSRWFEGGTYHHQAGDEYNFRLGYVNSLWSSVDFPK